VVSARRTKGDEYTLVVLGDLGKKGGTFRLEEDVPIKPGGGSEGERTGVSNAGGKEGWRGAGGCFQSGSAQVPGERGALG